MIRLNNEFLTIIIINMFSNILIRLPDDDSSVDYR